MSLELKPCPHCGGPVDFHGKQHHPDCNGCHYVYCPTCTLMADFSPIADPENSAETIEELRARIAPFWNRRAIQHWTESARARITAAEARIAELEAQLAAHN